MFLLDDTICAPATSVGTGAISVVRVSGPQALAIVDKVVCFRKGMASDSEGYRVKYGSVLQQDGSPLDDVLVSVFRAPHSYTGEDGVEISCHASRFIVTSLLARLVEAGCRMAGPGEFTRRAFVNGKMDLAQAEAVADVIASDSKASHRVALNQLRGGYSSSLRTLRKQLVELAALMELELDFSEEEVEFADRGRLLSLLEAASAEVDRLAGSFRVGNAIKNGVPVAIAGAVNTGKSTLLNALVGEDRAIVSDIAGTTRDTVEDCVNIDGVTFRFIDTAGLRETSETVEKIGIERSLASVSKAEIVLGVVDLSLGYSAVAEAVSALKSMVADSIVANDQTLIIVGNKADCGVDSSECICISAKYGTGLEVLRSELVRVASDRLGGVSDSCLVTNMRHYQALQSASASLSQVRSGLCSGISTDLVAQDLRAAISDLGEILGEIGSDEVLGEIFGRFCIGK